MVGLELNTDHRAEFAVAEQRQDGRFGERRAFQSIPPDHLQQVFHRPDLPQYAVVDCAAAPGLPGGSAYFIVFDSVQPSGPPSSWSVKPEYEEINMKPVAMKRSATLWTTTLMVAAMALVLPAFGAATASPEVVRP